jgi:hypothetical protein
MPFVTYTMFVNDLQDDFWHVALGTSSVGNMIIVME